MAHFFWKNAHGNDADQAANEDDRNGDENPNVDFRFVADDFECEGVWVKGAVAVDVDWDLVEVFEGGGVFFIGGFDGIGRVDEDIFVLFYGG